MADTGRRRVGANMPPPRSPPRFQPQQNAPQQNAQRYARPAAAAAPAGRGGGPAPRTPPVNNNAKMGIKSGMTVEDLKRLTQQRMQQSGAAATDARQTPATPTAASVGGAGAAPPTPTINIAVVQASGGGSAASVPTPTPLVPKAGMSVQELKQLTSLRLASQNVPMHQSEITGLVSKAVLSNAAKSHYRESLRGPLTPSTTPKRTGMPTTPVRNSLRAESDQYDPMAGRHSLPSRPLGIPSMRGGDVDRVRASDFGLHSLDHMRYSYSGPGDFEDSDSDDDVEFTRHSLDLDGEGKYNFDEFNALPFREDSFPPPPPIEENRGFVATSLPSWSPPPVRSKKLEPAAPPVSFYSQQSSFFSQQQAKEDVSRDQNAVIAPPPGLSRRPSMTVPWQVAEAVLNTPQTTTGRKTVMSPTSSGRSEPLTSNMFANPMKPTSQKVDGTGLKTPAAEVAAELSMLSLARQRSGAPPPAPGPTPSVPLSTSPPGSNVGPRRGSFGNAAEFFKFRRRSKSRLELARDIAASNAYMESGGFPNYGSTGGGPGSSGGNGTMPGIDERLDVQENFSVVANADTSDDEDYGGSEGGGSFVSFYNAAGVGKNRDNLSGLTSLSIPPPPPPPLTDDEDNASTTSSSKGLPMMSPNGVRLRKVAELARRGSLSSEDKTRVKDEIIQSSLGIGASNAARILTAKPTNGATPIPGPPPSGASPSPPPGFQRLATTPPRDTPKATGKTLPSGIVRNVSTGIAARSPPKPSTMLSPTTAASRKALSPTSAQGGAGTLEERLAAAAQRVADCVTKGDMVAFQAAMSELDSIRNEANEKMLRG